MISALYHAMVAPLTFLMYLRYVVHHSVQSGANMPWLPWLALLAYFGLPSLAGVLVGAGVNADRRWARLLAGRAPQPRAWDFVWSGKRQVTVRLRLKTGGWIGGVFGVTAGGRRPYASGYPQLGDLYLPYTVAVDPETGTFRRGPDGLPQVSNTGILVRWDEVEYLILDDLIKGTL